MQKIKHHNQRKQRRVTQHLSHLCYSKIPFAVRLCCGTARENVAGLERRKRWSSFCCHTGAPNKSGARNMKGTAEKRIFPYYNSLRDVCRKPVCHRVSATHTGITPNRAWSLTEGPETTCCSKTTLHGWYRVEHTRPSTHGGITLKSQMVPTGRCVVVHR